MTMFSGANQLEETGDDPQRHAACKDTVSADLVGILDTVDVPILVVARDGSLSRFNKAAADVLGLAAIDIGRSACDLGALADLKDFPKLCVQVLEDAVPCRREMQSGDRRFLLRLAPYAGSSGQVEGTVVTLTNITAFRASIDQAIYEREFTKAILNTVSHPLVVLGNGLRVQTANRAFYALFGVSREKSHAVPLCELGNDDWKNSTIWASLQAALSDDSDFQPFELECEFPAVGRRTVVLDARRLARDRDAMVLLTFHDITDRKRSEAVILQNQKALTEADRRKDEFLATLAHELRNPLAPIRNSLHILRMTNGSVPEAADVHEMMERQVAHMVRLVDDLLELSRISRGKIELQKDRIELATIISQAIETSRPFIESAGQRLSVSLPSKPVVIDGDLVRLSQVFANLLNNAAKYSEPGGNITVAARLEETAVVISIRDTGIGIPPAMLGQIFEMFAQVDNLLRRSQGGLGIGLSLVRSLVTMHGGTVEAHSDGEGHGSELIVRLPIADQQIMAPKSSNTHGDNDGTLLAAHRILVVDDNRDAADSLSRLLKLLGSEIKVTYDGQTALEVLWSFRPSIVLMDLGMPGLDGYEVAARVRQDPQFRDVTLIALTGWGQEENRLRAKVAGFDHHLVKPVDLAALRALLDSSSETNS